MSQIMTISTFYLFSQCAQMYYYQALITCLPHSTSPPTTLQVILRYIFALLNRAAQFSEIPFSSIQKHVRNVFYSSLAQLAPVTQKCINQSHSSYHFNKTLPSKVDYYQEVLHINIDFSQTIVIPDYGLSRFFIYTYESFVLIYNLHYIFSITI